MIISRSMLRDRVTQRRQSTVTTSTTGVKKQVWGDIAVNIPASIQARSAQVFLTEGGEKDQSDFMGFFLPDLDLRVGDEIVRASGERLLVTYVADRRGHHLEAEMRSNEE